MEGKNEVQEVSDIPHNRKPDMTRCDAAAVVSRSSGVSPGTYPQGVQECSEEANR